MKTLFPGSLPCINEIRVMNTFKLTICLLAGQFFTAASTVDSQTVVQHSSPGRGAVYQESVARAEAPLEKRISINLTNVSLQDALREISKKSGVDFMYSRAVVPVTTKVSIKADSIRLADVLLRILAGTRVEARPSSNGGVRLVRTSESDKSQTEESPGVISGRLVDSTTRLGISGATVEVQGIKRNALSGQNGDFILRDIPPGEYSVGIRAFGYLPVNRFVRVESDGRVVLTVEMAPSATRLSDVVTTATGTQRKVEVGNAVTTLDVEEIIKTAPISSVTDLLEGRVPGLTVQHTTGAPGDPARIRIGGLGSINRSNDPVIIVDGVRVQGPVSDGDGANLAVRRNAYAQFDTWAPSALDQIDPNSIETIDVFKGPSAATLYGPDAANGVIVITTKKGRMGPTRVSVTMDRGWATIPGDIPEGYFAFGKLRYTDTPAFCQVATRNMCSADSTVRYQLLNDKDRTVYGTGSNSALTTSITGGVSSMQYSLTASVRDEVGILTLPRAERTWYRDWTGKDAPAWMKKPLSMGMWNVSSTLNSQLSGNVNVSISAGLSKQSQQRSSMENQISRLMSTFITPDREVFVLDALHEGEQELVLKDFFQRTTSNSTNFRGNSSLNWRPLEWLTGIANVGLNTVNRQDGFLRPRGLPVAGNDTIGQYNEGTGNNVHTSFNLQGIVQHSVGYGFNFRGSLGANYYQSESRSLTVTSRNLYSGREGIGQQNVVATSTNSEEATFGWYIEPQINHRRLWFSPGIRFDGGNTYGRNIPLFRLPKLSFSWLASDEGFFPDAVKAYVNTLRVRTAYGQAGRQPGPADRLRLYTDSLTEAKLNALGNSQLRPEKSSEFEIGFDADMFDGRFNVDFTTHRKTTNDALLHVPLPSSIALGGGGPRTLRNIGKVKNSWSELSFSAIPVQTDALTWNFSMNVSTMKNVLSSLGRNVEPFSTLTGSGWQIRIAEGYPLFGLWANTVLGYSDINQDGFIDKHEILLSDTLVYMGQQSPKYEFGGYTSLSMLRSTVLLSLNWNYSSGQTIQQRYGSLYMRGAVDRNASLEEQVVASRNTVGQGLIQTVSTFQLNSVSLSYQMPRQFASRLKARGASIALQGSNLGIWSSYAGKDPGINSVVGAENYGTMDGGGLPRSRDWQLRLNLNY